MKTFLEEIKAEIANQHKNVTFGDVDVTELLLHASGSFIKGYHLEFSSINMEEAHEICDAFAEHDIFANITQTETVRVYIKDSESICNLLALVGANKSLYKLNNQIAMRDVRNTSNRRANCDTANISRQIETSTRQIALIKKIDQAKLPPELLQIAKARLDNPTATYDELAIILGISKSAAVYRMKKLLNLFD